MKISIITPSFNRPDFLNETIESVLTQKGSFSIEYIVQDGGSGKDVIDILELWKRKVDSGNLNIRCENISFDYYVEPDKGMYDAITKGFNRTSGEIMAWINSDDMYHPAAFQSVFQVFEKFDNVYWITGIPNSYNLYGSRTGYDKTPDVYSKKYVEAGFYDTKFSEYGFNWIQQESTIWKRVLWECTSGLNLDMRYAADFDLWQNFAVHADLVRVASFLGGFRVHGNQITSDPAIYRSELRNHTQPPEGLKTIHKLFQVSPRSRDKYLLDNTEARQRLLDLGISRDDLTGRTIEWDYSKNEWVQFWKLII